MYLWTSLHDLRCDQPNSYTLQPMERKIKKSKFPRAKALGMFAIAHKEVSIFKRFKEDVMVWNFACNCRLCESFILHRLSLDKFLFVVVAFCLLVILILRYFILYVYNCISIFLYFIHLLLYMLFLFVC